MSDPIGELMVEHAKLQEQKATESVDVVNMEVIRSDLSQFKREKECQQFEKHLAALIKELEDPKNKGEVRTNPADQGWRLSYFKMRIRETRAGFLKGGHARTLIPKDYDLRRLTFADNGVELIVRDRLTYSKGNADMTITSSHRGPTLCIDGALPYSKPFAEAFALVVKHCGPSIVGEVIFSDFSPDDLQDIKRIFADVKREDINLKGGFVHIPV